MPLVLVNICMDEMLKKLWMYVLFDLREQYEHLRCRDESDLIQVRKDIFSKTNRPVGILIDEWDCLFREYAHNTEAQKKYLDLLRAWLKDQAYVALAYMTGILPIKKYGDEIRAIRCLLYTSPSPRDS